MEYRYIGETIEGFNAFPIWLIKDNKYDMVKQSKMQELEGVADFKDESGDTKQVPMKVMVNG